MKRRDIFRVPARVENRKDLGWVMIVTLGTVDHVFTYGDDKPMLVNSPINLVLEYTVPDDGS